MKKLAVDSGQRVEVLPTAPVDAQDELDEIA